MRARFNTLNAFHSGARRAQRRAATATHHPAIIRALQQNCGIWLQHHNAMGVNPKSSFAHPNPVKM